MNFPRTPESFDYDLWVEQDGTCMVRIKATGETTAVSKEVMQLLRAEERNIRRRQENNLIKVEEGEYITRNLSYDQVEEDDKILEIWLSDNNKEADMVITEIVLKETREKLTPRQKDVYDRVLFGGMGIREYARRNNVHHKTVEECINEIRRKLKKNLGKT